MIKFVQEYNPLYGVYPVDEVKMMISFRGVDYEISVPGMIGWWIAIDKNGELNIFQREPIVSDWEMWVPPVGGCDFTNIGNFYDYVDDKQHVIDIDEWQTTCKKIEFSYKPTKVVF